VRNRRRTWANVNAPLKATAVFDAATVLVAEGVNTVPDMLRAVQHDHQRLKARWRSVPGQRT
jgi:hypothetical protein